LYDKLIHADWSSNPKKKSMAVAESSSGVWQVAAPRLVPTAMEFMNHCLFGNQTVLAGFDFPIGLPIAFGKRTGFTNFPEALAKFGTGDWKEFFNVADRPSEISIRRPFYPRKQKKGSKQIHLFDAHNVENMDALCRVCERKTLEGRRAACSLFRTLGGNQVGKAAVDGWQSIIQPARLRGARLWPFDGSLNELSSSPGCVLCETYPQEAYGHVNVRFRLGSKKRQADRRSAGVTLLSWAKQHNVMLSTEARGALLDGFGPSKAGEDPFDAFIGLCSMIQVVDGRRGEGSASGFDGMSWEGWILGQCAR
jgi:hypothetical protein